MRKYGQNVPFQGHNKDSNLQLRALCVEFGMGEVCYYLPINKNHNKYGFICHAWTNSWCREFKHWHRYWSVEWSLVNWSKMDIEQCCLWSSMKELCHGFDCIVVAAFDFIVVAAHHRVARGNFRRCYSGGPKLWQGPRLDIRNLFQGSRPSWPIVDFQI